MRSEDARTVLRRADVVEIHLRAAQIGGVAGAGNQPPEHPLRLPAIPAALTSGPATSSSRRPYRSARMPSGTLSTRRAAAKALRLRPSCAAVAPRLSASSGSTGVITPWPLIIRLVDAIMASTFSCCRSSAQRSRTWPRARSTSDGGRPPSSSSNGAGRCELPCTKHRWCRTRRWHRARGGAASQRRMAVCYLSTIGRQLATVRYGT
jgi:hypothetical protein